MTNKLVLRVATFLVPSISVEFFEALLRYLEREMGCRTTLMYESRMETPPADLFKGSHAVDIAFVTAHGFVEAKKGEAKGFELLGLTTEHEREKGAHGSGVSIEVVVNKNMKDMPNLDKLAGCRWVRNLNDRLTLALTLDQLNLIGQSALFFSNVLKSRSHLDSIRMILQRKAHASAIDANALQMYLRDNPDDRSELFSIASWGPLPPYAIAVRKDLDPEVRDEVCHTLAHMHETKEGREILSSFKIKRFAPVTVDELAVGEDYIQATRGLSFDVAYY